MKENENEFEISELSEALLPEREELISLLDSRKYGEFAAIVSKAQAIDIVECFDGIEKEYYPRFFRLLPKELAAEVFVLMDPETREHIISSFTDSELSAMLSELYIDDTVDIIEEMPANVVKRILKNSDKESRAAINELLKYPRDSAGTVMTPEYVRFVGDMTVEAALSHLRRVAIDKETIYTCYVTDRERHLLGIV
ncbi:MAG: magnesium transporter, partial [Clostridia bacterium]|nr:magnesium transporter [Clostridia bacterium]